MPPRLPASPIDEADLFHGYGLRCDTPLLTVEAVRDVLATLPADPDVDALRDTAPRRACPCHAETLP